MSALDAYLTRYEVTSARIRSGTVWASRDGTQTFKVESFDGAYAVVTNLTGNPYPQSLVNWDHFGTTYQEVKP